MPIFEDSSVRNDTLYHLWQFPVENRFDFSALFKLICFERADHSFNILGTKIIIHNIQCESVLTH